MPIILKFAVTSNSVIYALLIRDKCKSDTLVPAPPLPKELAVMRQTTSYFADFSMINYIIIINNNIY